MFRRGFLFRLLSVTVQAKKKPRGAFSSGLSVSAFQQLTDALQKRKRHIHIIHLIEVFHNVHSPLFNPVACFGRNKAPSCLHSILFPTSPAFVKRGSIKSNNSLKGVVSMNPRWFNSTLQSGTMLFSSRGR